MVATILRESFKMAAPSLVAGWLHDSSPLSLLSVNERFNYSRWEGSEPARGQTPHSETEPVVPRLLFLAARSIRGSLKVCRQAAG